MKSDWRKTVNVQKRRGRKTERAALLSPCKALFRNNEAGLQGNISQCHILAVSMVLALPAHLQPPAFEMKESGIKNDTEAYAHNPIRPRSWMKLRLAPLIEAVFCLVTPKTFLLKAMLFKELPPAVWQRTESWSEKQNERPKKGRFGLHSQVAMPQKR